MFQFACNCLNITINAKKVEPVDISKLPLHQNETFFRTKLTETLRNLCEINLAQPSLCRERQIGSVLITTCLCCDQETFATFDNDKLLINSTLEKDAKTLKELRELDNYSNLYKIILPNSLANPNVYGSSFNHGRQNYALGDVVESIWQLANEYLCKEQREMEERIRIFTENQYAEYNNLQSKIMKEKQTLMDLIHGRNAVAASPLKMMNLPLSLGFPSPPTSPENSGEKTVKTPNLDNSLRRNYVRSVSSPTQKGILSRNSAMASNIMKRSEENNSTGIFNRRRAQSIHTATNYDSNTIFDMEGLEDEPPAAFPISDDEEADTDDSTVEESERRNKVPQMSRNQRNDQSCAKSLPITVPLWSAFNHPDLSDDDEPKKPSPDPQQIAASMKALAMVSRDDKEMFGDLPRRRLNTGELVKSRPI